MGKALRAGIAVGSNVPDYPGRKKAEGVVDALIGDALKHYAGRAVQRLLGFWMLVNAYGSFDEYRDAGLVSRATAYASLNEFIAIFGCDPLDWNPSMSVRFPELIGRVPLPFEETG